MSAINPIQELTGPRTHELATAGGFIPAGADSEGMGFADVMRILKQRRLTIIITTVLVYVLVVVGTFLVQKYAPAYSAEAVFQLDPPRRAGLSGETQDVNNAMMEQMLQTEANKLRGLDLMMKVVADLEIQKSQYYDWYEKDAPKCAEGLRKDLSVAPIPDTQLIRMVLACRNRAESKLIVAKIADMYVNSYSLDAKEDMHKRAQNLKTTHAAMSADLDKKRAELARHRQASEASSLEGARLVAQDYLAKLKAQIAEMSAGAAAIEAQIASLSGVDPSQLPLTAEQQLLIESDPILRYYRSQVEALDVETVSLATVLGPEHRQLVVLRDRRQGYYDKEVAKREELMNQVRTRQLENLKETRATRVNMLGDYENKLREAEVQQRDVDKQIGIAKNMEQDIDNLRAQMARVEMEYKEAENAHNDPTRIRLRVVQQPVEATKASRPNFPIYLGGGFAISIMCGVALAFLREFTDKKIRTPLDVARFGHFSVLGTIPLLDDEEAEIDAIEDAVRLAPHSLVAESFRKVRTNLQFSGPRESQRLLLITSPSPGDGKTSVAINLAVTLAHGNQRVLLIDCNFRRPAIREKFSSSKPDGLSNILTGQAQLADVVTATDLPNLSILTSGPMPVRPAELLGSQAMRDMLAQALGRYDRVILDGPPALLISDAVVLAMLVDGVILVARADTNAKGALKRAHEQLSSINARVVGAVLNGVRARAGGYFKQQYREYYDYTSDEVIPTDLPGLPEAPDALDKRS